MKSNYIKVLRVLYFLSIIFSFGILFKEIEISQIHNGGMYYKFYSMKLFSCYTILFIFIFSIFMFWKDSKFKEGYSLILGFLMCFMWIKSIQILGILFAGLSLFSIMFSPILSPKKNFRDTQ